MAGQSSNLRASSSRRSRRMEEIDRQLDAAKRQRSSHQLDATAVAHPNGAAAVPVVPLHYAAGGHAMPMTLTFSMAGVNGAALHWSTAATLGAAGTAAAVLPLPAIAGVNPAAAPLVVGPMLIGPPAAPAVGLPIAVTLDRIRNSALGAVLSALMLSCDPPVGQRRQGWTGAPPPWWPTAEEDWWVPEVVAHLNTMRPHTPVPFAPAYKLKKVHKVAVLVAVVKHLSPDFDGISEKVEVSQNAKAKLTAEEKNLWKSTIENEAARHRCKSGSVPMVPVFNFVLQQQQAPAPVQHNDGHRLPPIGGATTENVVCGGVAAADDCERQVVNLAGGASVTAPAGDGGQAVSAAEPEQHGDGDLHGGAMAASDIPGGGDVHQVAAEPEQQCLIHVITDMDQVLDDMLAPYQMQLQGGEAHQAVDMEVPGAEEAVEVAPEGRPWCDRIFDDFEVPEVTPHSYY